MVANSVLIVAIQNVGDFMIGFINFVISVSGNTILALGFRAIGLPIETTFVIWFLMFPLFSSVSHFLVTKFDSSEIDQEVTPQVKFAITQLTVFAIMILSFWAYYILAYLFNIL